MAWPKGQPRKTAARVAIETMGQDTEQQAPVPVDIPEQQAAEIKTGERIAERETTVYHNDREPLNVKAGDPIPDGYTENPGELDGVLWQNNSDGSWYKINR